MKVKFSSIAKAVTVLILLTILPIVAQQYIPTELRRVLTTQTGMDILGIINNVAVLGVVIAVFILVRGHLTKNSREYLIAGIAWKSFLLFVVFFILGAGHPETFGVFVIGGRSGDNGAANIVAFDFRLFALLAAIIVVIMIVRSVLQFQEAKNQGSSQQNVTEPAVATPEKIFET